MSDIIEEFMKEREAEKVEPAKETKPVTDIKKVEFKAGYPPNLNKIKGLKDDSLLWIRAAKPCPICGNRPLIKDRTSSGHKWHYIWCESCNYEIASGNTYPRGAVKMWNTVTAGIEQKLGIVDSDEEVIPF